MARLYSTLLAGACLCAGALGKVFPRQSGNLPTVTSEGNAFWANGERFYIRGVAYQPGGAADAQDPLLDMSSLRRDIQRFTELGINTIRVYTIDNSKNHDEAMSMLDEAGIYLALDANTPEFSLNRESLDTLHQSYNDVYLQSVFATIDAFAGYNNLLLFFSGNEVINARNNTQAAPYIKAVTRDMKRYISAQADRSIPVGYSSADVAENIESQALYFACGDDQWARSDFFAFNDYSWCSPSSFTQSGWDQKVETYRDYSLPLFLSEFGCIENTRTWEEIESLYSQNMSVAYSGGLAYEYTLEANGYGLVEQSGNGIVPNEDFRRLKAAYAATSNPTGDGGASRQRSNVPACPPRTSEWNVRTENLPEIPAKAENYISNGVSNGPGLNAESSQWRGQPSETEPDLSDGTQESEDVSNGDNSGSSDGSSGGSSGGSDSDSDNDENGAAALGFSTVLLGLAGAAAAFAAM
ncbi:uncharacterized protein LTR77_009605 [Saxophila tyrrhenica]|uniref:1,3-beta-glucanosyltransferase n=1 Tax=Saxophila tyrrhenica TaxID=1690608 RepID=A0AAV9P200_9PEZI|nr:hypothetical protein LTR77_009605 [Saxophila tyrrhenica]